VTDRLATKEAAALAGVVVSTWEAYVTRGYAPQPDGRFGNQRYWLRSTIEDWKANRPGQGRSPAALREVAGKLDTLREQ
jgi:predicted DNA-binding transcriptional regulator AlpA